MTINLKSLELVIVVVLLIGGPTNGSETKRCPSYCTCDLFENFNRADCSGQRLITPNVEVPTAVELLDLSYNDITTLDNVCFEGLIYLVNLTIAHNAVHTIYLDAFRPLKEAKSIDLSYNRLEYFDERILEANTKLIRLDMSGNKFMSLQNKPFLRSTSIRYLGLHDAQVPYIYPTMFQEMPALREVDISNNLMITLGVNAFSSLHRLEALNLEQNRWICDKALDVTLQFLKKRGVETKLSSCTAFDLKKGRSGNGAPLMFERMVEAPPALVEHRESASVENIWKPKGPMYFEHDEAVNCEQQSPAKICELYLTSLYQMRILMKEKAAWVAPTRGMYNQNDLEFAFSTGVLLGIVLVTSFTFCWICIRQCIATKKNITPRRTEGTRVVNVTAQHRPIPPPVPPRHRRSNRRPANPQPPLNRSMSSPVRRGPPPDSNQSDFATFLTRLFERPTRHQYYRTINQNTAHMIRRLSQSNLFNNRLSQHFTGARNGNSESVQQTEPLIYPQTVESRPTSSQPQVHRSPEDRWQAVRESVATAPLMRPETPPPSYGDVINPKGIV